MALLTRQAQLSSQSALLRFGKLNPLGANLAIGPVVTLLALLYGASDLQTGLLYASVHLCGVIVLIAPLLCQGLDASRVYAGAWLARSSLSMAYLVLPFLPGNQFKIWLLIVVYFGFMTARAIGVIASQVVTKTICRPGELGAFVSRQLSWWHIGTIAINLLTAAILNRAGWFPSREWAFFSILVLGIPLNFAASWALRRLPPTGILPQGSPLKLLATIPSVWHNLERREVVLLAGLIVPMGIAAGYQLNYFKVVLHLSDDIVFLTTIGGMLAMLMGAYLAGVVGRSIGFRPLQFGAHGLLAVCGLAMAWGTLLPVPLQAPAAIAIYILNSLCISVSGTVFSALSIDRLGDAHRMETSIIFQLAATLAAGLGLGIVALGKSLCADSIPGGHLYSHICLIGAFFSLCVCWSSLRLRRPDDNAWGDIAFLHPANLVSAVRMHQVENSSEPILERMHSLENILSSGTAVGRARMLELLASPDTALRASAYRSLYIDPQPAARPLVLREALEATSPLRREAITALGFLKDRSLLPALRPLLTGSSPRLAATTFKTLMRLGEHPSESEILKAWERWSDPSDRQEILIGLSSCKQASALSALLRAELAAGHSGLALRQLMLHLADVLGERHEICEIWAAEENRSGSMEAFLLGEIGTLAALADLADPGMDRQAWRERVAKRLGYTAIGDDLTALSLLFLACRGMAREENTISLTS